MEGAHCVMEDLQKRIFALEDVVHRVDKDNGMLTVSVQSLLKSVEALTITVKHLDTTISEQRGALKFVRAGWLAIGSVLTALGTAWLEYRSKRP